MTPKRPIPLVSDPEVFERFWARADTSGGLEACWMWQGSRATEGRYGTFHAPDGKRYRAHRWIYAQLVGINDDSNDVDHVCHNEDDSCTVWDECEHHGCVNPAHLEEVTHEVNALRGKSFMAEHSRKTHCPQGHPYDEENTDATSGSRVCRECHRVRVRNADRLARGIALDAPVKKGRAKKTVCKWGHSRTPENVYPSGACRPCTLRRNAERSAA